jgi:hypothetical protein
MWPPGAEKPLFVKTIEGDSVMAQKLLTAEERAKIVLDFLKVHPEEKFICSRGCRHTAEEFIRAAFQEIIDECSQSSLFPPRCLGAATTSAAMGGTRDAASASISCPALTPKRSSPTSCGCNATT